MHYPHILPARFLFRPNRFIAHCEAKGKEVIAHVKNTGRCKELLLPGATVYLQHHTGGGRKTEYSLICVDKGGLLVNIDSQAPNKVAEEALAGGQLTLPGMGVPGFIRREAAFGQSRFDFYLEGKGKKAFLEVKGVTLEKNGAVRFPDAPTLRGVKHLRELTAAREAGFLAYVLFVVQLSPAAYFVPNDVTHPAFGEALRMAARAGVQVLAYDCAVTPESIALGQPVPVRL